VNAAYQKRKERGGLAVMHSRRKEERGKRKKVK
jgi:hypothetical protein